MLKLDAEGNVGSTCPGSIGRPSNAQVTDTDVEPMPISLSASAVDVSAFSAITTATGRSVTDDIVVTRQCAGTSITAHFLTVETEGRRNHPERTCRHRMRRRRPVHRTVRHRQHRGPVTPPGRRLGLRRLERGTATEDGGVVMERDARCTATFEPIDDEPVEVAEEEGEEIEEGRGRRGGGRRSWKRGRG